MTRIYIALAALLALTACGQPTTVVVVVEPAPVRAILPDSNTQHKILVHARTVGRYPF